MRDENGDNTARPWRLLWIPSNSLLSVLRIRVRNSLLSFLIRCGRQNEFSIFHDPLVLGSILSWVIAPLCSWLLGCKSDVTVDHRPSCISLWFKATEFTLAKAHGLIDVSHSDVALLTLWTLRAVVLPWLPGSQFVNGVKCILPSVTCFRIREPLLTQQGIYLCSLHFYFKSMSPNYWQSTYHQIKSPWNDPKIWSNFS